MTSFNIRPGLIAASACFFALLAACGPASETSPSISGQWEAEYIDEEDTLRVVMDLGQLGSRWVGEFDVPDYYVENYPVDIGWADSRVTLYFTAAEWNFEGTLSRDGGTLSGTAKIEDREEPVVFRRVAAAPQFSEGFLALEASADDTLAVEKLSTSGAELRERFNADKDKTRLLMLLSPT